MLLLFYPKPKPCQQGLVDTSLASTFLHKFNVATTGMVKDDVANQCSFELDYMPGSQCASKREGGVDGVTRSVIYI